MFSVIPVKYLLHFVVQPPAKSLIALFLVRLGSADLRRSSTYEQSEGGEGDDEHPSIQQHQQKVFIFFHLRGSSSVEKPMGINDIALRCFRP